MVERASHEGLRRGLRLFQTRVAGNGLTWLITRRPYPVLDAIIGCGVLKVA
jgi:hypothetical protein